MRQGNLTQTPQTSGDGLLVCGTESSYLVYQVAVKAIKGRAMISTRVASDGLDEQRKKRGKNMKAGSINM